MPLIYVKIERKLVLEEQDNKKIVQCIITDCIYAQE